MTTTFFARFSFNNSLLQDNRFFLVKWGNKLEIILLTKRKCWFFRWNIKCSRRNITFFDNKFFFSTKSPYFRQEARIFREEIIFSTKSSYFRQTSLFNQKKLNYFEEIHLSRQNPVLFRWIPLERSLWCLHCLSLHQKKALSLQMIDLLHHRSALFINLYATMAIIRFVNNLANEHRGNKSSPRWYHAENASKKFFFKALA